MHAVIQECPVCQKTLEVTQLHCRSCDTVIGGHFALGRFHSLSQEQLQFADIFIRCEGKIKQVEKEMGISYPTVRAKLHDLIRAMGYEVKEEEPASLAIDRKTILAELASGTITAEQAAAKLAGG